MDERTANEEKTMPLMLKPISDAPLDEPVLIYDKDGDDPIVAVRTKDGMQSTAAYADDSFIKDYCWWAELPEVELPGQSSP